MEQQVHPNASHVADDVQLVWKKGGYARYAPYARYAG
jgi:hypothetical protein